MQQSTDITSTTPTAVTVGTFDGVHRGHREVVNFLIDRSRQRGLRPVVITFEPHPLAVVAPERAPKLLELPSEREEYLRSLGAEVVVLPFDEELRRMTAADWIASLGEKYCTRLLIAGYDNTFGSDGMAMSLSDYRSLGEKHGIDVLEAPVVKGVSSTLIRQALGSGDIASVTDMLGHRYSLSGEVAHGRGLGRQIGFPTANIAVDPSLLLPAPGVYAADAVLSDGSVHRSVVNIGVSPTVRPGLPLTVEAYLTGFSGDLYGSRVRLDFFRRLRDERRFPDLEALRNQISADIQAANKED